MKAKTFLEWEELKTTISVYEQELDILVERFAYGKFDDEILYQRLRIKKQEEINLI